MTEKKLQMIEEVTEQLSHIEHKDHCIRVGRFSRRLAEQYGLEKKESNIIGMMGYFHDVGKTEIPPDLLNKRGRITDEERTILESHSEKGELVLKRIGIFEGNQHIIRHHHENYDGSGYPDGLAGEEIPLFSRIIAIADVYDALTSQRPYRDKEFTEIEALEVIESESGRKFDPVLVRIFLRNFIDIVRDETYQKVV